MSTGNERLLRNFSQSLDEEKYLRQIDELKRENTQLRLDNLRIHKESKAQNEIILRLTRDIKELRSINEDLYKIAEEYEKIDIDGTIGIYAEDN
ncbi:hypothetical protein BY458DRAFT_529871 [Sporodiniella umbellata]|nr:hypothetical protein BY458DRAFT_529871 [Sporodiniella umbellata]